MPNLLLTREQFNSLVMQRDGHKCVLCNSKENLVVHHIIDRSLFKDQGFYKDNGATVCPYCHWLCETTDISVEQVRKACGITNIVLPEHLTNDVYDKWGNPILPNGQRLKGELFDKENVQKILKEHLSKFTSLVKYPRTYHALFSPNLQNDDRMIENYHSFVDKEIIVTTKMDGENCSMYNDHIHARSLDSMNHPSRTMVKQIWGTIKQDIPDGWRICGENLYAKHSIHYTDLKSYFYGFSIWNEKNICLSWDETIEWFDLLGIMPVEVVYRGIFNIDKVENLFNSVAEQGHEGIVVRTSDSFHYRDFKTCTMKAVREKHVRTSQHWMRETLIKNEIV